MVQEKPAAQKSFKQPKLKQKRTSNAQNPQIQELETEFKQKFDQMLNVDPKRKPPSTSIPRKIQEAHNGAVERYMQELQRKAKEDKQYIHEAKRLRQFFNT